MNEKIIGVIFGGRSTEHDISIVSAISAVIKPLLAVGEKVLPIYIDKEGVWRAGEDFGKIENYKADKFASMLEKNKPVMLDLNGGLTIIFGEARVFRGAMRAKIDIVFPVMHGGYGEDGSLAGILRMAGVPFVGCDLEASAVAMDKVLAKEVAVANDIATPKFLHFASEEFRGNPEGVIEEILDKLDLPVFVKPPRLGSSIGITKVSRKEDLGNALEVAAFYDSEILVEEGVRNLIEVTVPIIGSDEDLFVANVEKPLAKDDGVFDFETKYMKGGKKGGKVSGGSDSAQGYSEVPANLSGDLYERAQEIAKKVYTVVGCRGIARIDLLIDPKQDLIYFNEINPMPGSLYAHNFAKSGISNVDLVLKLLDFARKDYEKQEKLNKVFDSSFLEQF
ncbi:MAG: D-alanine--D-alanine ligase [Candidatus Nomurabacteria bacterium]|jgi:D-alanine-D-alanine ligase|nr:D-alanine--D-alanine ligase [Candidatus Nomurabacteria bacterium]